MIKIVLLYGLPILLAIYALIDCIQTDEEPDPRPAEDRLDRPDRAGGHRRSRGLVDRGPPPDRRVPPPLPGSRDPSAQPPRTLAPDDDPEFLGRLGSHNAYDRQLEEWEEELRKRSGDDPPEGDEPG